MKLLRRLCCALVLSACSEARDLVEDAGAVTDVVRATDTVIATDAVSVTDVVAPADVQGTMDAGGARDSGAAGRVVINEVRASGDDWIELYNPGATTVDLAGLGVTDSETADGTTARVADKVVFPPGTTLGPGEYLLVVADLSMPGMGPQTTCLADAGPSRCFHAGFGISSSRGETLHLLDAMDRPVDRLAFPADGDGGVPSGQTWARLPNGGGTFGRGAPTPGAANRAP